MTILEQARAIRAAMDRQREKLRAVTGLLEALEAQPGLPELLQLVRQLREALRS